jgi:hypothetical protein
VIIALVIVAAVSFAAGFAVKHYLAAGKLASIEATLKIYEASPTNEVRELIRDVRVRF